MVFGDGPFGPHGEEYQDFVPAVLARVMEEAQAYCEILNEHDIPTVISADGDPEQDEVSDVDHGQRISHGIHVLVPEELLDEASAILAGQDGADVFDTEDEDLLDDDDDEDVAFGFSEFDPNEVGDDDEDDLLDEDDETL